MTNKLNLCRFTEFGGSKTQRPVQDLAFAVARFIQTGGSFVNYYMVTFCYRASRLRFSHYFYPECYIDSDTYLFNQYHGGTNFGRTAGGPFITTSYDYDAPLDEYGKIEELFIL